MNTVGWPSASSARESTARRAKRRSSNSSLPKPKPSNRVAGIPPFHVARELIRRVQADCGVEIDGNAYSVPWRLIGETVRATLMDRVVRIHHGSQEVAVHLACAGHHRQRAVDPAHFEGLAGFRSIRARPGDPPASANLPPALLRYEVLLGGGF
jgi:hypothetical protein